MRTNDSGCRFGGSLGVCFGLEWSYLGSRIEDNCTSTGGVFTGGHRGRRKNLILVIIGLSKSEASCSSASKTSGSSSLSSVIRSAFFLSRSHKISLSFVAIAPECSTARLRLVLSGNKGVVGSPSSISATLLRILERCALYPLERSEGV